MIRGSGAPRCVLLYPDGSTYATLDLTRPNRREAQDFEEVYASLGSDADGQPVTEFLGVRFHAVLLWISHADNQTAMASVLRAANWRGGDKAVRFYPHYSDAPNLAARCVISSASERPLDGTVLAEELRIELYGLDLLPEKPQTAYAVIHRRRGHVNAA